MPDGARHPQTSAYLHDDLVLSAALCAVLDGLPWSAASGSGIIRAPDPLDDMRGF